VPLQAVQGPLHQNLAFAAARSRARAGLRGATHALLASSGELRPNRILYGAINALHRPCTTCGDLNGTTGRPRQVDLHRRHHIERAPFFAPRYPQPHLRQIFYAKPL
jgi:hypothetical protein